MIKYICDNCGKAFEKSELNSVENFGVHMDLCSECHNIFNDLSLIERAKLISEEPAKVIQDYYGFKVGQTVIFDDGQIGKISSICLCVECAKRGFYELFVACDNGKEICINCYDAAENFKNFYRIGEHIFGNVDVESAIEDYEFYSKLVEEDNMKLKYFKECLKRVREMKSNN